MLEDEGVLGVVYAGEALGRGARSRRRYARGRCVTRAVLERVPVRAGEDGRNCDVIGGNEVHVRPARDGVRGEVARRGQDGDVRGGDVPRAVEQIPVRAREDRKLLQFAIGETCYFRFMYVALQSAGFQQAFVLAK